MLSLPVRLCAGDPANPPAPPDLLASLDLGEGVAEGHPLFLLLTVTNQSKWRQSLPNSWVQTLGNRTLEFRDAAGRLVPVSVQPPPEMLGGNTEIESGETRTFTIALDSIGLIAQLKARGLLDAIIEVRHKRLSSAKLRISVDQQGVIKQR